MLKVVQRNILPYIFHFPETFVLAWGAQIEHSINSQGKKNQTAQFDWKFWSCHVIHLFLSSFLYGQRTATLYSCQGLLFKSTWPVMLPCSCSTSQQCFSLTRLQQQPVATSQPAVFFSHTTPAAASSTSTANRANVCNIDTYLLEHSKLYIATLKYHKLKHIE